ncbi:MAG: hypothetical protein N2439_10995, partial [Anaerolineae bacterium]|nr:hypothetical protein [Anaerolineae bacterium]
MSAIDCGSRSVRARGWIAVWFAAMWIGGMLPAQAAGTPAQMISPVPGSTFDSDTVTFTWDGGAGVSFYAIWVGNAPRTFDLFVWAGSALSRTVKLPADGRRIYVTLWSWLNGRWQAAGYDYVAFTGPPPAKAQLLSPAEGSTFTNATVTFTWDAGSGVSCYALWIGSRPNSFDLYARLETGLSRTVTLPADGRAIYVTLWSWINGAWEKNSYTFTAFTGPPPVAAQMVSPTDGETFTNRTVTFTWDGGIGVSHIALWIGSTPKSFDLYAG